MMVIRAVALVAFVISIAGVYAWLTSDDVPRQIDLIQVNGTVIRVDYTYDKYRYVTGVKFWLPQEEKFYYYGSFLPNFKHVKEVVALGATVRLSTTRRKHEIWRLEVNGEALADRDQIAKAHHVNGNWGLGLALGMTLSGTYLLWIGRRLPASPNTRRI